MVKEHPLSTRYRAVGMINGGMTQAQVARDLGVGVATIRTIRRWQTCDRREKRLKSPSSVARPGRSPPSRGSTACFGVTCPRLPAASPRTVYVSALLRRPPRPAHPTAPSVRRVGGLERPPTCATSAGPGSTCGMPDSRHGR